MFAFVLFVTPNITKADDKCSFDDTLELGSIGESVRCLQKYLNSNGYTVSSSGAGSFGSETDTFREKTKEAVKKWQIANGVYPATGNFGPLSKSVYEVLTKKSTPVTTTTSSTQTNSGNTTTVVSNTSNQTSSNTSTSYSDSSVKKLIKTVRDSIKESEEMIDNEEDDGKNVTNMRASLQKAKDKLVDAMYSYIDGEYEDAVNTLNRAKKYSDDSVEDIKDDKDKQDAEEAIADAKKAISDARDEIDDADEDKDNVDGAMDIYNDAKAKYNDAREAYDDEKYSKAIDLAEEAENMADDAIDEL